MSLIDFLFGSDTRIVIFSVVLMVIFVLILFITSRDGERYLRRRRRKKKEKKEKLLRAIRDIDKVSKPKDWLKLFASFGALVFFVLIISGLASHFPYVSAIEEMCISPYTHCENKQIDYYYELPEDKGLATYFRPKNLNLNMECTCDWENKTYKRSILIERKG